MKKESYIGTYLFIAFAILFTLRVIVFLGIQASSVYWEETDGTVSNDYKYHYIVNGKEYVNYTVNYQPHNFGNQLVDDKSAYSSGKVKVYYSKRFHQMAVLQKGISTKSIIIWGSIYLVFFIIMKIAFTSVNSSEKLNEMLKKMGFRVNRSSNSFGTYKIEEASDNFSDFFLNSRSEGDASFTGWPTAAIEKDGRFIELTRIIDYDNSRKQLIKFTLETSWSLHWNIRNKQMHGVARKQLYSTKKQIENEELRYIYLRKQFNYKTEKITNEKIKYLRSNYSISRPEFLSMEPINSGNNIFSKFFGIKTGSLRVRKALRNNQRDIVDSLTKWGKVIYDVIVDEDNIKILLNINKFKGFSASSLKVLSNSMPQLIDDFIAFAKELENVLLSYKLEIDNFHEVEYRYATVFGIAKCKKCNADIPINGPLKNIICKNCNTKNSLNLTKEWSKVLYHPYRNIDKGKFIFSKDYLEDLNIKKLSWKKSDGVLCRHCKEKIPDRIIKKQPKNIYSEFLCPKCNGVNFSFPLPEWAKDANPFLDLIFNANSDDMGNKIKIFQIQNRKNGLCVIGT